IESPEGQTQVRSRSSSITSETALSGGTYSSRPGVPSSMIRQWGREGGKATGQTRPSDITAQCATPSPQRFVSRAGSSKDTLLGAKLAGSRLVEERFVAPAAAGGWLASRRRICRYVPVGTIASGNAAAEAFPCGSASKSI